MLSLVSHLTPIQRPSRHGHMLRMASIHRVIDTGHCLRPETNSEFKSMKQTAIQSQMTAELKQT